MKRRRYSLGDILPALFPALMLTVFFVVPFGIMLAVSFFRRIQGAFYEPAFVLDNYARFLSVFFAERLLFSLGLAALVAFCASLWGFPSPTSSPSCRAGSRSSGWSVCLPCSRSRR